MNPLCSQSMSQPLGTRLGASIIALRETATSFDSSGSDMLKQQAAWASSLPQVKPYEYIPSRKIVVAVVTVWTISVPCRAPIHATPLGRSLVRWRGATCF